MHCGLLCFNFNSIPPCGRVGEWLKPADCKSAAPCGLRRFESSPVHHLVRTARGERSWRAAGEDLNANRQERGMSLLENRSRCEIRWRTSYSVKDCAACGKQNSPG